MTLVTPAYRDLLRELHERRQPTEKAEHRQAAPILAYVREIGARSILDYGCGQGTLGRALRASGWKGELREYDPAVAGKDAAPDPVDLVVSTDVLEHVEKECIDNVLDHIKTLARKGAYLHICTQPGHKRLADGRDAHLLVRNALWWEWMIRDRWVVQDRSVRENAEGEADVTFWVLAKPVTMEVAA